MISRMKKFNLFFTSEPSEILKKLQKAGVVEIEQLPENFEFKNLKVEKIEIEENIRKINFLKNVLKRVEKKEFSGKIVLTEKEEREIVENFPLDKYFEYFSSLLKEIERREKINHRIENLIEEILPLKELDINFSDLFSLKNFSFLLFSLSKKIKIPSEIEEVAIDKVGETEKENIYLMIFPKEKKEKIEEFVREIKGKQIFVRRWNRRPKEIIEKLEEIKKKNTVEKEKIEKKLEKIKEIKYRIFVLYDYFSTILNYLDAKEKLGISKFVKGFSGWIKEKDIKYFKNFVKENLPESYLYISDPSPEENIPIDLENPKVIQPFEVVTDLYGRPVYRNIDPTGPLSLFFAISFAFCLTDAGYGLILIILSLLFMKKFKLFPTFLKFFKLLLYSGIATFLFGMITGGWFGDLLSRTSENSILRKTLGSLVILNPLESGNNAFMFLAWALVIGYVQIIWGLILNLYNSLRRYGIKNSGEAITLLLIQVLVAVVILNVIKGKGIPIFYIILLGGCFLYLMISKAKTQKGLMMKLFWAFYGVYSVIASNLLGDVLSYSRLFGLGLTTGVLALVVNEMVFMAKGIPFAGIIIAPLLFIIGHFGNLAINLLGGYVHTSRLQYLEFFTKFFEGGGKPFSPLREARHYTYLKKT